jgi:hypothetical protein
MSELLLRLPTWRGRILYLPPLTSEWRRARVATAAATGAAILWWAFVAHGTPWTFLVPLVPLAIGPVLYIRSWRVWDLLVWDSEQPWYTPAAEQDAGYEAMSQAFLAVALRQPEAVRAAVTSVADLTVWQSTTALYYSGLADLMEGHMPDLAPLAAQSERLDPEARRNSANVMIALLAAGSASLADGDWRPPLLACRNQLGVRFSVRRALWPLRIAHVVMLAAYAIVVGLLAVVGWGIRLF